MVLRGTTGALTNAAVAAIAQANLAAAQVAGGEVIAGCNLEEIVSSPTPKIAQGDDRCRVAAQIERQSSRLGIDHLVTRKIARAEPEATIAIAKLEPPRGAATAFRAERMKLRALAPLTDEDGAIATNGFPAIVRAIRATNKQDTK